MITRLNVFGHSFSTGKFVRVPFNNKFAPVHSELIDTTFVIELVLESAEHVFLRQAAGPGGRLVLRRKFRSSWCTMRLYAGYAWYEVVLYPDVRNGQHVQLFLPGNPAYLVFDVRREKFSLRWESCGAPA